MTDDSRVGMFAFLTVANWVIGTIITEHGVVSAVSGRGLDRGDDPIQRFSDRLSAEERFNEGIEIVLAGLESRYF